MATLTKKLNILPNGGGQVSCSIYSTTTEVGANYVPTTVDGVNGYIPIGSTSDTRATKGRVTKSSTTYAILTSAKPAYTEKSYTTVGTHTFTVPAGITRIRVAVCGGGGGGIILYYTKDSPVNRPGGASSFGNLISATGGQASATYVMTSSGGGKGGAPATYSKTSNCAGGTPNGNAGAAGTYPNQVDTTTVGGAGFALSFTKTSGTYGKGGDIFTKYYVKNNHSGGSGGYNTGYFNVTPGTTYTITVGAGGSGFSSHGDFGYGYAGNSGFVLVAYGGDI